MAYSNTGWKRATEIKINKSLGGGTPSLFATIYVRDAFTYNSVDYPAITDDAITKLSGDDYTARMDALKAHINADMQGTYPGINAGFTVSDYYIHDTNACPL